MTVDVPQLRRQDHLDRRQPRHHAGHEQQVGGPHLPRPAVQLQPELCRPGGQCRCGCRVQGHLDPLRLGRGVDGPDRRRTTGDGPRLENGGVNSREGDAVLPDHDGLAADGDAEVHRLDSDNARDTAPKRGFNRWLRNQRTYPKARVLLRI